MGDFCYSTCTCRGSALDYLPFIFGSAIGLFIYYYGTLLALKKGGLSICYPIIRSSPVFIVFVGWAVLDHSYSLVLLLGIAVVLTGAFLIQRGSAAQVKLITQPVVLALAFAAMAGAGIYSLVDSIAMQRTASLSTQPLRASTFLIWVYVVLSVFLANLINDEPFPLPLGEAIWRALEAPFVASFRRVCYVVCFLRPYTHSL